MANIPKEFPIFTKLDERQITLLRSRVKVYFKDFELNCGITYIYTSDSVMIEIYERIEKRRIYFHIFYNGCKMGELNEGALMCFWILKLMPFSHQEIPTNELNAKIALYLFNNMLLFYARNNNRKVNITNLINNDLFYSFRFRDISKESIMTLAKSLII